MAATTPMAMTLETSTVTKAPRNRVATTIQTSNAQVVQRLIARLNCASGSVDDATQSAGEHR